MEPTVNDVLNDDEKFGIFVTPGFRYTCPYTNCGLQFKRKDQLNSHEYVHTKRKKFSCIEANCDKSYVNNAHLQRHIRRVHRLSGDGTLANVDCTYETSSMASTSETKIQQNDQQIHTKIHKDQYKCDYCSAEFYRKIQLRLHVATHTGQYPYKCVPCDRGFIRLTLLKRHEKTHKSHKCKRCDAIFPKWSQMIVHNRKEHAECKCTVCNRVFHSRQGLKYHQQVHEETNERTIYQCDFDKCPKFFFHRQNLLAHHKSKHDKRKFVCTVSGCERELSTKQKLDLHMRIIHLNEKPKIITKKKKVTVRNTRKDKGVPIRSTAAKLLDLIPPKEIEQAILAGRGDSIRFHYDNNDANDMDVDESTMDKCSAAQQMMEMIEA